MRKLNLMRAHVSSLANCGLIVALSLTVFGQQTPPPAKPNSGAPPAAGKRLEAQSLYRLRVTKTAPITVSLKAKNAPVADIAAALGRKLEVPIILSPLMQRQKVSLDFAGMPLEAALKLLAPQPFVDYEVNSDAGGLQKPVGIYLNAFNEASPSPNAVVKGDSEVMLVEGNTEEEANAAADDKARDAPLRVRFEKNLLSVRARKQPLTAVLYEIASQADIPFEMKYESSELVEVDFNQYTIEQAVRSLSPNIRLYTRVDLSSYETKPLRLVLVAPTNAQQSTNK